MSGPVNAYVALKHFRHDGEVIAPGERIDLSPDQAGRLLRASIVERVADDYVKPVPPPPRDPAEVAHEALERRRLDAGWEQRARWLELAFDALALRVAALQRGKR